MMDGAVRIGADSPVPEAEAATLFAPLSREPALVLAISGGPDSTALLCLVAHWRDSLKRPPKLMAVTIDHGLRPESAQEALAVKRLAKKLKVAHETLRWTGRKPKTGIQEAARNARYRLLAKAAHRAGAAYILTAHTQDDQAETVLFRLMRGSGVTGLRGMALAAALPPALAGKRRLYLSRPLLPVPKSRLIATLAACGIPFADDPSNRDPRFTRPRLRELMPLLAAEGLTAQRLALLAERVTRTEIVLYDVLNAALMRLAPGPWPEKGPVSVDSSAFADLPAEIALRLLGRLIEWTGSEGPVELGKLEALFASLEGPITDVLLTPLTAGRFRRTLAGAMVTLSATKLTVERAPARKTHGKPLARKGVFTKPG
jgi:tRNA(Ile)-lysidine synthase